MNAGELLIPMRAEDGQVIAYQLSPPVNAGELVIPAMATDGAVAMGVSAMLNTGEIGLPGQGSDGVTLALKGEIEHSLMIMVFCDEASSIYAPDNVVYWDEDFIWWNSLMTEYGPPMYAGAFRVFGQDYDILPSSRSCPDEITYGNIARNPTLQEMITAYNTCKGGSDEPNPQSVIICIDVSGSMNRSTMEPGIDEFEEWLINGGTETPDPANPLQVIEWLEVPFSNERWLSLTCAWYELYMQAQEEAA